ncbi:unnamed protein product, partial [Staurois parvus]
SWGIQAIGEHGAPLSLPKLIKAYEKGTRGILWGPLLTPGPRAVPEFPNGQSAPAQPSKVEVKTGLSYPTASTRIELQLHPNVKEIPALTVVI